jgi:hypothetical protein
VHLHYDEGDEVEGAFHAAVLIQSAVIVALHVGETLCSESILRETRFVLRAK